MTVYRKQDLMQDPSSLFNTPRDLLEAPDLSARQKTVILEQWKNDVLQRMVAEEENMDGDPGNAERLRQISNALEAINDKS
jgi:hypothetical protein